MNNAHTWRYMFAVLAAAVALSDSAAGSDAVNGQGRLTRLRVFGPFQRFAPVPAPDVLRSMPERLELVGRSAVGRDIASATPRLDLTDVLGFQDMGSVAYVFAELETSSDGTADIGAGADWWFQLWVDGELACDTLDVGNNAWPVHITNHRVAADLAKGRHIVVLRAVRGSATFDVALAGPDELRAVPQSEWVAAPPTPPEALALWSGEDAAEGALLFTRGMGGVFLRAIEGLQCVAFPHGAYVSPRFVPGRAAIVLNSRRGGRMGIWEEELHGAGRRRICDGEQADVSADGRLLLFQRNGTIWRREIEGNTEKQISPSGWDTCAFPAWRPDGTALFTALPADGNRTVFALKPGSTAPEPLFAGEILCAPRSSPDCAFIAYQDGAHLMLYEAATRTARRLTFAGGIQSRPAWSRDGAALLYLQSPSEFDGPRHIYRLELADPARVTLVWRDVEAGFDWNGMGFAVGPEYELNVADIKFRTAQTPQQLPLSVADLERAWTIGQAGEAAEAKELLVETGWGGVYVSSGLNRIAMLSREKNVLSACAEIKLADGSGAFAAAVSACSAARLGNGVARLELTLRAAAGGAMKAALEVFSVEPAVKLVPVANVGDIFLQHALVAAVAPDRLGDDLLYWSGDCSGSVRLPMAPFVLGMSAAPAGMLMVVPSAEGIRLWLEPGPSPAAFSGFRVAAGNGEVYAAFLAGGDLWTETTVRSPDGGKSWKADYTSSFPGKWRLAATGGRAYYSVMALKDTPMLNEEMPLPGAEFGGGPVRGLIYLYDRSANMRLDRMSPLDILRAIFGLERTSALTAERDVRLYRLAPEWTPIKSPDQAFGMMTGVWRWDTPGGVARIERLCSYVVALLRGLDERTAEYESFLAELEQWRAQAADAAAAGLIKEKIGQIPAGTALISASEIMALAREMPADRAKLGPFSERVRQAFAQRQKFVGAARQLARFCRSYAAALESGAADKIAAQAAQLRAAAGAALRRRHYLEGDWRGETPLAEVREFNTVYGVGE